MLRTGCLPHLLAHHLVSPASPCRHGSSSSTQAMSAMSCSPQACLIVCNCLEPTVCTGVVSHGHTPPCYPSPRLRGAGKCPAKRPCTSPSAAGRAVRPGRSSLASQGVTTTVRAGSVEPRPLQALQEPVVRLGAHPPQLFGRPRRRTPPWP